MKEKTSALHSKYIIDGVSRRLTPAEMLDDCIASKEGVVPNNGEFEPVVDESTDPSPSMKKFQNQNVQGYLATVVSLLDEPRPFPAAYADPYTRGRIAKALLDAVWLNGRFKLGDLTLAAKWRWNCKPLGNMAAFYSSAEATADYINNLGICLSGYSFTESGRVCQTSFKVGACEKAESPDEDDIFLPKTLLSAASIRCLAGAGPFRTNWPRIRTAGSSTCRLTRVTSGSAVRFSATLSDRTRQFPGNRRRRFY